MKKIFGMISWMACAVALASSPVAGQEPQAVPEESGVYAFQVNAIDGKIVPLSQYRGKALLIVNTASKCGYTYQYGPLEELYRKFKDSGFEILAFPANNFGNQEPGSNEEIKAFCALKFKTTFPLFAKISVKGRDIHPLYRFLTSQGPTAGPITWNFNKFLIDAQGRVVARFASEMDPLAPDLIKSLEAILPRQ